MFGTANQLLACIALAIGTSFIINRGRAKYAWVTIIPMTFVGITTLTAGFLNIKNIYLPQIQNAGTMVPGYDQSYPYIMHYDMCCYYPL